MSNYYKEGVTGKYILIKRLHNIRAVAVDNTDSDTINIQNIRIYDNNNNLINLDPKKVSVSSTFENNHNLWDIKFALKPTTTNNIDNINSNLYHSAFYDRAGTIMIELAQSTKISKIVLVPRANFNDRMTNLCVEIIEEDKKKIKFRTIIRNNDMITVNTPDPKKKLPFQNKLQKTWTSLKESILPNNNIPNIIINTNGINCDDCVDSGWQYMGCFNDKETSALEKKIDDSNYDEINCIIAAAKNGYNIAGLQDNGKCWVGKLGVNDYAKYGKASNCKRLGDAFKSQIYINDNPLPTPPTPPPQVTQPSQTTPPPQAIIAPQCNTTLNFTDIKSKMETIKSKINTLNSNIPKINKLMNDIYTSCDKDLTNFVSKKKTYDTNLSSMKIDITNKDGTVLRTFSIDETYEGFINYTSNYAPISSNNVSMYGNTARDKNIEKFANFIQPKLNVYEPFEDSWKNDTTTQPTKFNIPYVRPQVQRSNNFVDTDIPIVRKANFEQNINDTTTDLLTRRMVYQKDKMNSFWYNSK